MSDSASSCLLALPPLAVINIRQEDDQLGVFLAVPTFCPRCQPFLIGRMAFSIDV
jgi:hypothetical protein